MTNVHKSHDHAVELVLKHLPDAISADNVFGYHKPYDIQWQGINLRVKIARPSKKISQNKKRYYYTLEEKKRRFINFYILFILTAGDKIKGIFVLPKVLAPKRYVTITDTNNTIRYERFRTDLIGLAKKIVEVNSLLPKLAKMKKEYGK